MVDRLSPERRSWNMSRIRGRDTKPERAVLKILRGLRYRADAHRPDLPGKPDIVLPRRRTIVFVNGCFWHRHSRCRFAYTPKSNRGFWNRKFEDNVQRDRRVRRALRRLGWHILVVWECQLRDQDKLRIRIREQLRGTRSRRT